jgi:3-keto-5-aminohexanoate cleavage enzyme
MTRNKLIINAAITGVVPTKSNTPHIPLTPHEIIDDALACLEAGAAMLHLHARDADGEPTWDPDIYGEIITGIRAERPDAVLCASLSGRRVSDVNKRAAVLDLDAAARPDMGSLTLGSLNFVREPSINSPETIQELARRMLERGVKPELEVFEPGMIHYAKYLQKKELIKGPWYVNILLGSLGTSPGEVRQLAHMVDMLPEDAIWGGAGIGSAQLEINAAAVVMGGNVRVGLEDNLYYDSARSRLATNVQLIERVKRIAAEMERPVATSAEVREMLDMRQSPQLRSIAGGARVSG